MLLGMPGACACSICSRGRAGGCKPREKCGMVDVVLSISVVGTGLAVSRSGCERLRAVSSR
jgi:hypothetical protein